MKTLIVTVLLFSLPSLACKMTPIAYDAYRIAEAAKYFSENTVVSSQAHISSVRINKDDLIVVESELERQCFVTTYTVSLNADCSPQVALVKSTGACKGSSSNSLGDIVLKTDGSASQMSYVDARNYCSKKGTRLP